MPRRSCQHVCSSCGAVALRWSGRCGVCGEWNSLVEETSPPEERSRAAVRAVSAGSPAGGSIPLPLGEVDAEAARPEPTGVSEFDRVLSGGLVPGSVTLLGGEPGIGKSTLVLQAVARARGGRCRSLVIAGEESAGQVRRRAERIGALPPECYVLSTGDLLTSVEAADRLRPELLVVDSIQTMRDPELSPAPGSPNQVRECAQLLARYAKATGLATILVGHVTKDGALAGPRTLEHLVDTVLSFDGDRHHALRTLVATKHRFGPAGELGLFEMGEAGLRSLEDPSELLLGDRRDDAAGSVVLPVLEGRRPLLVEVQALSAPSRMPVPRRVVQGISGARVTLLLAVLERNGHDLAGSSDAFVSTVGGIKVTEPAADLAVSVALQSALSGVPVPADTVVFGEVGLAGEVRQVPKSDRRLAESARMGFKRAVVPGGTPESTAAIALERVRSVDEAAAVLGLFDAREPGARRDGQLGAGVGAAPNG